LFASLNVQKLLTEKFEIIAASAPMLAEEPSRNDSVANEENINLANNS